MKIRANHTVFFVPIRPIPYSEEEQMQLIRFLWKLPVDPHLSPAEARLVDVWLQHLLHNGGRFELPKTFTVAELTNALIDRFGEQAVDFAIDDGVATNMLHRVFAAGPTVNFRQLHLVLGHDAKGKATVRVEHHPVEWPRALQYAWRLAGLSLPAEEEDEDERAQQAAA